MNPTTIDHPKKIVWKGYESKNPRVGKIEDLEAITTLDGAITSGWKPTWSELWGMLWGRPLWIGVLANRLPPIGLYVNHEPHNLPERDREPYRG